MHSFPALFLQTLDSIIKIFESKVVDAVQQHMANKNNTSGV
jgi:hypothetical protein